MSRKRSRKLTKPIERDVKFTKTKSNKKVLTVLILVGIFCLVMFLNSYFNYT